MRIHGLWGIAWAAAAVLGATGSAHAASYVAGTPATVEARPIPAEAILVNPAAPMDTADIAPADSRNHWLDVMTGADAVVSTVQRTTPSDQPGHLPEPATWAMLLIGFAMIGGAIRIAIRRSQARFEARVRRIAEGLEP